MTAAGRCGWWSRSPARSSSGPTTAPGSPTTCWRCPAADASTQPAGSPDSYQRWTVRVGSVHDCEATVIGKPALEFLHEAAGEPAAPAAELGSTAAIKAEAMAGTDPAILSRLAVAAEL